MPIVFRGSREELTRMLRLIPAALAGTRLDTSVPTRALLTRMGIRLLSLVQAAFIVKSRGGTDAAGIKWPPLSRKTIAARRTTRAERKSLGVGGRRTRGLLTPAQDKRWRGIFASTLAHMNARGVAGGAARAAAIAWATLKREGAKTKLEVLGGRTVEILRSTSQLLRSLTPGLSEEIAAKKPGQIMDVRPGQVVIGSNIPYAITHHRGVPGRIPARPLWPTNGQLPDAWWAAIGETLQRGVMLLIANMVSRKG